MLREMAQQARHETGPHVLEREGRAMEELQRADAPCHGDHRAVEGEGLLYDTVQLVRRDVLAEQGVRDRAGDLLEGHGLDVLVELLRQHGDALRHVEAPVLGEAADDGLLEGGQGGLSVGAVVLHTAMQ